MAECHVSTEQIAAMAIAAIAEEEKTDASCIRIISFREVPRSPLEKYLADHQIAYHKYQLGEEL